jgi:DNA-binding CsgD family transcriptional regulator
MSATKTAYTSLSRDLAAVGAIAHAASAGTEPTECAAVVLEELQGLVPYECAELSYYDPVSSDARVLANVGYADALIAHMHGSRWKHAADDLGLRSSGEPLRLADVPRNSLSERLVEELLLPEGFRGGLTVFLLARDRRCVGMLNLSTTDRRHPTDGAKAVIRCLNEALANAVDWSRSLCWLVGAFEPGSGAAVVMHDEAVAPLPGRRFPACLEPGSPLVALVASLLAGSDRFASFLWYDANEGWLGVKAFAICGPAPKSDAQAVVMVTPTDLPYELTAREVEVLSLVAAGSSNVEIAGELVVSRRTVSTHVEHILEKLGVSSRAAAAGRASSEGFLLGNRLERVSRSRSVI